LKKGKLYTFHEAKIYTQQNEIEYEISFFFSDNYAYEVNHLLEKPAPDNISILLKLMEEHPDEF
jgi:hypothetical protein